MAAQRRYVAPKKGSGGEGVAMFMLVFMVLLVLAFLRWQVAAFIAGGLLPTFVLAATGHGVWHSHRMQCVGAMNLAGTIPYAVKLWSSPMMFYTLGTEVVTWMLVWGAASVGYMLLYVGPFIASVAVQSLNKERLRVLTKQRQALIDEWGAEVAQDPAKDKTGPR